MIRRICLIRLIAAMGLFVILTGCGDRSYPLAPVSGRITLDEVPLANARVGFEPIHQEGRLDSGPGSYASTDAEGRFQLESLDGNNGAVIGEHHVWIRTIQAEEGPNGEIKILVPEKLPNRYHSPTVLKFTVPNEGTDKADFSLTNDAGKIGDP